MSYTNSGNSNDPRQENFPQRFPQSSGAARPQPQAPYGNPGPGPQQWNAGSYSAYPASRQQSIQPSSQMPGSPVQTMQPGPTIQPAPPQKKSRRGLWITLALGLVAVVIIAAFAFMYFNRSTPTSTLTTYCNAIKSKDYVTAYSQLSSRFQQHLTEKAFASSLQLSNNKAVGSVNSCAVSNVQDDGSTGEGTVTYSFSNGQTFNLVVHLVNENGAWKIEA